MEVFLFTNFFPFKKSEPFLVNEFPFTKSNSKKITVLSLYGREEDCSIAQSSSIKVLKPVFREAGNKSRIFFKGVLNLAPFDLHFRELFKKNILFNAKRLYWFAISLCIYRAALSSASLKKMVVEIERSENPLLYFYWGDNLAWIIPYLKRSIKNPNLRMIVRLHGSDLYEHLKGNYSPLRHELFSSADKLFTVSSFGKKYLLERYPQFSDKIEVARLGTADRGVCNAGKTGVFKILSVSNLVALKRVHLIFEALQLLDFQVEWHHYGDGPLRSALDEQVKFSKKNINVVFHGFVTNEELIQDLKQNYFDVFVNVSTSEGLPVSIMEAFSFGIPALATNVGGTSELVDETTGSLLPRDIGAKDLAREIVEFRSSLPTNANGKRGAARQRYLDLVNAESNYSKFYITLKALFSYR